VQIPREPHHLYDLKIPEFIQHAKVQLSTAEATNKNDKKNGIESYRHNI